MLERVLKVVANDNSLRWVGFIKASYLVVGIISNLCVQTTFHEYFVLLLSLLYGYIK